MTINLKLDKSMNNYEIKTEKELIRLIKNRLIDLTTLYNTMKNNDLIDYTEEEKLALFDILDILYTIE